MATTTLAILHELRQSLSESVFYIDDFVLSKFRILFFHSMSNNNVKRNKNEIDLSICIERYSKNANIKILNISHYKCPSKNIYIYILHAHDMQTKTACFISPISGKLKKVVSYLRVDIEMNNFVSLISKARRLKNLILC